MIKQTSATLHYLDTGQVAVDLNFDGPEDSRPKFEIIFAVVFAIQVLKELDKANLFEDLYEWLQSLDFERSQFLNSQHELSRAWTKYDNRKSNRFVNIRIGGPEVGCSLLYESRGFGWFRKTFKHQIHLAVKALLLYVAHEHREFSKIRHVFDRIPSFAKLVDQADMRRSDRINRKIITEIEALGTCDCGPVHFVGDLHDESQICITS